ncbi:methyltransferase, partial [Pseudoalteromonas piscicida]
REYWQCTAFDFDELPWPELQAALNNLSDEDVARLDNDQQQLYQFFSPFIAGVEQLPELCNLPKSQQQRSEYPF